MGAEDENVFGQVEKNIDHLAENSVDWTAARESLEAAGTDGGQCKNR